MEKIEKLEHEVIDYERGIGYSVSLDDVINKLNEVIDVLNGEPELREGEEDKKMLDSVIGIVTRYDDLAYEPTFAGPKWTHPYTKEIAWLKSLLPHWKPSEEQMKNLAYAMNALKGTLIEEHLESLYEQLKAL